MKLLRETIRKLIVELKDPGDPKHLRAGDSGEWDGILDMIETGKIRYWRQAISILESGIAQDYPEDAKLDIVHGIYDILKGWDLRHKRPIERSINTIEEKQILDKNDRKELVRLRLLSEDLTQELNELHKLVANLLGIPDSWYFDKTYEKDWEGWENLFKKAGII